MSTSSDADKIAATRLAMDRLSEAKVCNEERRYGGYSFYSSYYPRCRCKSCIIVVEGALRRQLENSELALETQNSMGETLVEVAGRSGAWSLCQQVIQKGAVVVGKNILTDADGLLYETVKTTNGFTDLFRLLQSRGFDFGRCDSFGRNILSQYIRIAEHQYTNTYQAMIRGGGLPFVKDHMGKTAMFHAIDRMFESGDELDSGIPSMLLENMLPEEKLLTLTTACSCGCEPMSHLLLHARISDNIKLLVGAENIIKAFLRSEVHVNAYSCHGHTPIMDLILANRWCYDKRTKKSISGYNPHNLIKSLLCTGRVQLDLKSKVEEKTALHLAAEKDMLEVCKLILTYHPEDVRIPLAGLSDRIKAILLRHGTQHSLEECARIPGHHSIFKRVCSSCKLQLPKSAYTPSQYKMRAPRCMRCMRVPCPTAKKSGQKFIPRNVEPLQTLAAIAFFQKKCYGCVESMCVSERDRAVLVSAKDIGKVWGERTRKETEMAMSLSKAKRTKATV